jgi:hypothetical protein
VPRPLGLLTDELFVLSIIIKTVAFFTRSTVSLFKLANNGEQKPTIAMTIISARVLNTTSFSSCA